MLDGYKTIIISGLAFITGVGSMLNIPVIVEVANLLTTNTDVLLAAVGVVFGVLRIITKTPVGGK